MRAPKFYNKVFYDSELAKEFGKEVDFIAQQTVIPSGKKGTPHTIFRGQFVSPSEEVEGSGTYYKIEKEQSFDGKKDTYTVHYGTFLDDHAKRTDRMNAEKEAKDYLQKKYEDLNKDEPDLCSDFSPSLY